MAQPPSSAKYPAWIEELSDEQGTLLRLLIQPKASRSGVVGPHGEPPRLKVRIAAPPVDGEANEELIRFLKKALGVSAGQLELLRGQTSKQKDVRCMGLSANRIREKLIALIPPPK